MPLVLARRAKRIAWRPGAAERAVDLPHCPPFAVADLPHLPYGQHGSEPAAEATGRRYPPSGRGMAAGGAVVAVSGHGIAPVPHRDARRSQCTCRAARCHPPNELVLHVLSTGFTQGGKLGPPPAHLSNSTHYDARPTLLSRPGENVRKTPD